MSDFFARAAARIENYVDEMVEFQTELVACPAVGPKNGGPGEAVKAEVAKKWFLNLKPAEVLDINAPDETVEAGFRPNLVALFKGRSERKVWVLSHLDIVPEGERTMWDSDPFVLRREGDRIYGRGVEDNHQGLVSSFFGLKALIDEGILPDFSVGLIFVADEETQSVFGLRHVLETRGDLFSPEDLIIVPDAGAPDGTMIEIAEKSSFWLKFTVHGKQCHGSVPQLGINTLRASARMITAIDQMLNTTYTDRDELFRPSVSTFEPTKKEANVPNINTIPGEDIFYFDCRVLPHYDLDEIQVKIQQEIDKVAAETGVTVQFDLVSKERAPAATPMDSPVVEALIRAIKTVHDREARPMGIGGGTVAKFFRQKGLPAAVWSTTDSTAHSPNEYCLLPNLVADAKVFAHVYLGL